MVRVLHVFKVYYPSIFGGIQQSIREIANGTARHGFRSTVFALGNESSPQPLILDRHEVVNVERQFNFASTGVSLSAFAPFRRYAAQADILHYHFPWPFMDVLHLTSTIRRPAILTYHSDIVRQSRLLQLYKPIMHRFLSDMDVIVATSPNYLESSAVLRSYSKKTTVIPLGISDDERVPKPSTVRAWRSELGHDFFLFLGNLRYYKGLSVLMDAAERTGLPVVIGGSGDQERSLRSKAPSNVRFIGHYSDDDRAALLSLARAFVFPSHRRSEAFGISLLEAARAGLPMISCEIGTGTTYVNKHNLTGFVVPPGDPEALSCAMHRLAAEPDTARRLGQGARNRFEVEFTAQPMAASYSQQYRALLDARKSIAGSPSGSQQQPWLQNSAKPGLF